jgi:rubrerythrin
MGKNIRSDHDILEEELIKPIKYKSYPSPTDNISTNLISEDLQNTQTYEQPSVPQLIKYKQQIRTENDRRLHREKLAQVAKTQREKEDLSLKSKEIQQQKLIDGELQIVPSEKITSTNLSHKSIVKSKEEEEILNDENVFKSRQNRYRERPRNKLSTPYSNTSYIRGGNMPDFRSLMKKPNENIICKVCGNAINGENNQPPIVDSQKGSGKFIYFKNIKIKYNFYLKVNQ